MYIKEFQDAERFLAIEVIQGNTRREVDLCVSRGIHLYTYIYVYVCTYRCMNKHEYCCIR